MDRSVPHVSDRVDSVVLKSNFYIKLGVWNFEALDRFLDTPLELRFLVLADVKSLFFGKEDKYRLFCREKRVRTCVFIFFFFFNLRFILFFRNNFRKITQACTVSYSSVSRGHYYGGIWNMVTSVTRKLNILANTTEESIDPVKSYELWLAGQRLDESLCISD